MTIIESDQFTGVNQFETRPYARVRMGQQLKQVAQDQAFAYKSLTGVEVPNAPGSDVAADHVHDGTNGACIPIPVAQEWLGATLARPPQLGGWAPVIFFPFYCPPGFDTYKVYVVTRTPEALGGMMRCSMMDSSLETTGGGTAFGTQPHPRYQVGPGMHVLSSTITTTPGEVNLLRLECMESSTAPDADILSYSLVPYFGEPAVTNSGLDFPDVSTVYAPPSATEHLGAHPFTSFDDTMFDDDRAISSYLINCLNKNNIYLLERSSNQAAGNRDTGTDSLYQGHRHGGSTAVGTKDAALGATMDHSLGAWAYGSARAGTTGTHPVDDMQHVSNTTWSGRIFAPTLSIGTTSSQEIVRHPIRLPKVNSGDYAHSTGDLNVAVLVRKSNSKNGIMQVTAQMRSADGASTGTAQSATTAASDGIELLTISGLDGQGSTTGEVERILSLSMALTTNATAGSCIYGVCCWVEP